MSTQIRTKTKVKAQSAPAFTSVSSNILQRRCACGGTPGPSGECAECSKKLLERQSRGQVEPSTAPPIVHEVLRSPGQPLDLHTRAFMEPRFGHDFSHIRVHTDGRASESARAVNALAYTVGRDVVFGAGQYAPGTSAGQHLLAHELTHAVQQGDHATSDLQRSMWRVGPTSDGHEQEALRVADAVAQDTSVPEIGRAQAATIQRRVEMRDVGRGEQSGFARLPELIERLNAISQGLTFSLNGQDLAYTVREGGTQSEFDRQMIGFIDQAAVIPMRLTNRQGLLGNRITGFNERVFEDAWSSGYVDVDDLLASTDLGLQSVLVHFLRERSATINYARRIGSPSLDLTQAAPQREFLRAHALGIEAEIALLRDFFGDPTIRFISEPGVAGIVRLYRNSRRDRIRTRVSSRRGVDAVSIDVVTSDGRTMTAEEYRDLLEAERTADQVRGERLRGATEHREGRLSVPAP